MDDCLSGKIWSQTIQFRLMGRDPMMPKAGLWITAKGSISAVTDDYDNLRDAAVAAAMQDDDAVTVLALLLDILQTLICSDDWLILELHHVMLPATASLEMSFRARAQDYRP